MYAKTNCMYASNSYSYNETYTATKIIPELALLLRWTLYKERK